VDFKAAVEEIIKAGFRSRDLISQLLANRAQADHYEDGVS
jgi:hypothetical protein